MKHEAPTEREIADLFAPAFDRLAEPDARRLAAIEQRLLERPRRRVGAAWWWLFAVLTTGAASALWWAVNYDSADGPEPTAPEIVSPPASTPAPEPAPPPGQTGNSETKSAGAPAPKQGPVIYRKGH
ncbi:hypothetical protein SCL_0389 [Sulfuricaulis limicola]|uniref:Uncharacterized protein n=1 Tax=Sulfuricaulis limicola TaxID=1620215 RepID=A0A1B4XD35_9GAMM|nr:hypothetical protein [Sulfuricaulis limicola]BAV32711.1 hypothetical protein SCL_0389 [Sulfuricaulis limicola]